MNYKSSKSWFGWEGINSRIPAFHFMTKICNVSVIVVYTPENLVWENKNSNE